MTVKLALSAALPEARRIAGVLERDFGEAGVAVSLDERDADLWSVEAYFPEGAPDEVEAGIRDRLGGDAFGAPLAVEALAPADWVAVGLAQLRPVFAGRFVVHGSHDRHRVPPGRIRIEIDAAQAFGTGHHATTAGCLEALDRLLGARRFRSPLDLGAGSGVLAIALAKALRARVLAGDIDPVAVRTARDNARRNGVAPLVRVVEAAGLAHPALRAAAPFDLVVANILARPLMELAPALVRALAPGGALVLSGLLSHQRERVVAAYRAQGARLVSARVVAGWGVLTLERPAAHPGAMERHCRAFRSSQLCSSSISLC
jgi:ribosomal protein L11 methyltransferase